MNANKSVTKRVKRTKTVVTSKPKRQPILKTQRKRKVQKIENKVRDCTAMFLAANEDPFNANPTCVPSMGSQPSQRVKRTVRGTFQTGSAGIGYIVASPGASMFSGTNSIISTNSNWGGTKTNNPYSGDINITKTAVPSDYESGIADQKAVFRLVGAGLRIRNRTPLMNRGAISYGYESDGHASLCSDTNSTDVNVSTLQEWLTNELCQDVDTENGEWASVTYHHLGPIDYTFTPAASLINNTSIINPSNFSLGFQVQSVVAGAAATQIFEFEYVVIYEVAGTQASGERPGEIDVVGFSNVCTLVQNQAVRQPRSGDRLPWLEKFVRTTKSLAGYAQDFIPVAKALVAAIL